MISEPNYTPVQKTGGSSLTVILTKQLKALGIKEKDKVYTAVEEVDGKKRIVIERVG